MFYKNRNFVGCGSAPIVKILKTSVTKFIFIKVAGLQLSNLHETNIFKGIFQLILPNGQNSWLVEIQSQWLFFITLTLVKPIGIAFFLRSYFFGFAQSFRNPGHAFVCNR